MNKRPKGMIIPSFIRDIDLLRVTCIKKILLFDDEIDYGKFDFLFGDKKNRPKRLIKLLISLDCLPNLEKISEIILNKH